MQHPLQTYGDWLAEHPELAPGQAAWGAATLELPVFPCWPTRDGACLCGREGCTAKHPIGPLVPRGLHDSSTDPDLVRRWWEAYPDALVALHLAPIGLLVLDFDGPEGLALLDDWAPVTETELPDTLRSATGGGGRHLFLVNVDNLGPSRARVLPGFEWKAGDSYVILPPSGHPSGGRYAFEGSGGVGVAEPGTDLRTWLRERSSGGSSTPEPAVGGDLEALGTATSYFELVQAAEARVRGGRGRNDTGFWVGCQLRDSGCAWGDAWNVWAPLVSQVLSSIAGDHPYTVDEARSSIAQAFRREAREPLPGFESRPATADYDPWSLLDRSGLLPAEVEREVRRRTIGEVAGILVRRERGAREFVAPSVVSLSSLLEQPEEEVEWTIRGLHERGSNTSLTATYKAGKTTLQLNLLRSLCSGDPFLGTYDVRRIEGRIAFFNYELSERQVRRWLVRMGVTNPEKVVVANLRGLRLDLGVEAAREWCITTLKQWEVEFWLADPLARAYYGEENSNTELKLWTDAVDEIKREAEVPDFQITIHTGRERQEEGQERARGATRIDDWVDARWVLVREGENRFLRADGRDVDVEEVALHYDEDSMRLEVDRFSGPRRVARAVGATDRLVRSLVELGATTLETAVSANTLYLHSRLNRQAGATALHDAVVQGRVRQVEGPRNSLLSWASNVGGEAHEVL